MPRPMLVKLSCAIALMLATACGGAQKKAEVPDFTEKGWSGGASDEPQAKGDPSIQSPPAKSDEIAKAPPAPEKMAAVTPEESSPAPAPSGASAGASSSSESDIVSGAALPKPPKAAKGTKSTGKPSKKARKKKPPTTG